MPTPASRQEFAALLNDARRRRHLSIRAVARIAQVPPTTAQGWLNGQHFPTPALRGNFLDLVEHLELTDRVPRDLWEDGWAALEPLQSGRSPYLGLRPYRTSDQELFFGRADQSARLAAAVRELHDGDGVGILALVGASGSGKSSLLAAGLLGQEVSSGSLTGWTGTSLPVIRLLAGDTVGEDGDPRRLVVVDQLEEGLALPPVPRAAFLEALGTLATRAVVVVGLRSEAFAAASAEPLLARALSHPILLPTLTPEEYRDVIVRPAETMSVAVDPELVRVLLDELGPGPAARMGTGALPLLSNALLLIWAVSNGRRLTLADHQAAGGIARAVERLAEQVYLSLEPAQKAAAERLFLRLVRVAGDVLVPETVPLAEVDASTRPAMEAFVMARMLTTDDDVVRISHQALLTHWQRLNDWLAEHSDDLAVMERLRSSAAVWAESGRDPAALVPVRRLAIFSRWIDRADRKRLLTDAEREFVAAADAWFAEAGQVERANHARLRRWQVAAAVLAGVAAALAIVLAVVLRG